MLVNAQLINKTKINKLELSERARQFQLLVCVWFAVLSGSDRADFSRGSDTYLVRRGSTESRKS